MSNNIFLVRRSSSSSGWATEAPVWGQGNNKAIRGRVSIHHSVEFCLYFPSLISEIAKKCLCWEKINKYTDFRLKWFAKIQLQQIRTKLARSSERPSSLKNMQWWASVSPCPLRETWPWLGPQWWSTSFCTIQTCKNTLTLANPLDSALFFPFK